MSTRLPSRNEIPPFVHWLRARKYVIDLTEDTWSIGTVVVEGERLHLFCDKKKKFGKVLLPAPLQALFDKYCSEKELQQRRIGRHNDVS
jgi:hypothetical protein